LIARSADGTELFHGLPRLCGIDRRLLEIDSAVSPPEKWVHGLARANKEAYFPDRGDAENRMIALRRRVAPVILGKTHSTG